VQLRADSGILQRRSRGDVEVAALSDEEKLAESGCDALDRRREVVEENDIAIHEAPQRPFRDRRRTLERAIEAWCAAIVSCEPASMLDANTSGGLLYSLLIPDEHDLDVVPKREPAFDGVPLDVADTATKRFRHREDRQHES